MSDIPLPGPSNDDEYYDYDYENDQIWSEWNAALGWARKGDHAPLAECLCRTDLPLNNQDVRAWLAGGLLGGFKKPRKVAKRPIKVLFEDADGRRFHLDRRHLKIFEAMKRVAELKAALGEDAAIEKARKEFGMKKADVLRQHLRRPRSRWGLSPVKHDGMFDSVLKKQ
jgi:hypothetical protein